MLNCHTCERASRLTSMSLQGGRYHEARKTCVQESTLQFTLLTLGKMLYWKINTSTRNITLYLSLIHI